MSGLCCWARRWSGILCAAVGTGVIPAAHAAEPRLNVQDGVFAEPLLEYRVTLRRLLLPDEFQIFLLTQPSFAPEHAVYLVRGNGRCSVHSTRLTASLWYALRRGTAAPRALRSSRPLDESTCGAMVDLWRESLRCVQSEDDDADSGVDGATYIFGLRDAFKVRVGETDNPRPDSWISRLAALGSSAFDLAESSEPLLSGREAALRTEAVRMYKELVARRHGRCGEQPAPER